MNKPSSHNGPAAKFLSGPIMGHIWVMTSTSTIGLIGLFLVDLLDMLFLSMLGSDDIIAGVGFATSVSFFTASLSIGITISMAALVSRMVGQYDIDQARRYVVNISVLALTLTSALALLIWLNIVPVLKLLGATGAPLQIGVDYLQILLPSLPILACGMAMSAALRAVGNARLSMYTTLASSVVNAVLDPIFIFTLGLGVEGAAIASVLSRFVMLGIAFYGVTKKHHLMTPFIYHNFITDLRPIFNVAGPAMLTNMATPVGNAIVINAMAKFGDSYVAGFAIIGRISPVAFGLVFALSGAIAPIIGQNFGAQQLHRVKEVLWNALFFNAAYVTAISLVLYVFQNPLIALFNLQGEAAELMRLFCTWIAITFMFNGAQFVANATFNNLGKPIYATWFNVGRSTVGTLPFVIVGGHIGGAPGVLVGEAIGCFLFAAAGVIVAVHHTNQLTRQSGTLSIQH